jgi:hypothetical protein
MDRYREDLEVRMQARMSRVNLDELARQREERNKQREQMNK